LPRKLRSTLLPCFNPRPRAEGDRNFGKREGGQPGFNPRPRAEGDALACRNEGVDPGFNPRPRAEGDFLERLHRDFTPVSIHALARRATCPSRTVRHVAYTFQSTPSRGGRPADTLTFPPLVVSIHALARRATRTLWFVRDWDAVSIHALARRATRVMPHRIRALRFQSTPSRGGRRLSLVPGGISLWFQSTPSRGGRLNRESFPRVRNSFNPRPRAEGDSTGTLLTTPPSRFNPRPRAEGDWHLVCEHNEDKDVSIHALARRATPASRRSGRG